MPAFNRKLSEFERADTQVLGISVDSVPSNDAWQKDLGGLDYPLLSDFWPHGKVSQQYGVLRAEGMSERAVIVVDRDGKIAHINVYDIATLPEPQDTLNVLEKM